METGNLCSLSGVELAQLEAQGIIDRLEVRAALCLKTVKLVEAQTATQKREAEEGRCCYEAAAAGAPKAIPTDPRQDPRPEAMRLFNPAFVDVPEDVRQRCIRQRQSVATALVRAAWGKTDWRHMAMMPLIGSTAMLPFKSHFMDALPHLGTAKVAYHARENWVCREYGFAFAVIVAAELQCNAGIVCDTDGHHLYSFVPVLRGGAYSGAVGEEDVECLIIEPQGDVVVPHTDPDRHYVGKAGFALLI